MNTLAKNLARIHQLGLVLGHFSTLDIFVEDSSHSLFAEWSIARESKTTEVLDKDIIKRLSNASKHLINSGSTSFASDVYCLGMVFSEMIALTNHRIPSAVDSKLK